MDSRLQLTAWLAAPRERSRDGAEMVALLDDALALVRPVAAQSHVYAPPRHYRLTPAGLSQLREELRHGHVESLDADGRSHPPIIPSKRDCDTGEQPRAFELSMTFLPYRVPDFPLSVGFKLLAAEDREWAHGADALVTFVDRWFVRLSCFSAFVSVEGWVGDRRIGDDGVQTADERELGIIVARPWSGIQRWIRGITWGMALGPPLCGRLGGSNAILQRAPVWLARAMGDGVWLQLSAIPPADVVAFDEMTRSTRAIREFLAPLLEWQTWQKGWQAPTGARSSTPTTGVGIHVDDQFRVETAEEDVWINVVDEELQSVELPDIELVDPENIGGALNLYWSAPPSGEQQEAVNAIADTWAQRWYGDGSIHELGRGWTDGPVTRWFIDFGGADVDLALRALVRDLRAVPGVKVERIVIGTEEVS